MGLSWQKGGLEMQVATTSYGTLNARLKAYAVPSNISQKEQNHSTGNQRQGLQIISILER